MRGGVGQHGGLAVVGLRRGSLPCAMATIVLPLIIRILMILVILVLVLILIRMIVAVGILMTVMRSLPVGVMVGRVSARVGRIATTKEVPIGATASTTANAAAPSVCVCAIWIRHRAV